ncbi:hypothetical protein HCH_07029 [Hahella chejuensis KCTC 2396]|uniref:Uncharacterized protein n=1 Tax=Hahella chejuensis (strain KCTC 2396) TaxID=349521 RepID=Q2S6S9_HAHCH|nr:hypothetical protein HCH_07029 [Hahella chejuensis KCTC 2396]
MAWLSISHLKKYSFTTLDEEGGVSTPLNLLDIEFLL